MKGREKERDRRARELEKKAREQADQSEYLNSDSLYLFFASHQQIQNIFNARLLVSFIFPVVALEEQRANLNRELGTLRHTHNKVRYSLLISTIVPPCTTSHSTVLCSSLFFRISFMPCPTVGSHTSGTFGKKKGF